MTDGGCVNHKVGKDETFCKKEAEKNKVGYCWVSPLKENKDFVPECHQACRSKEAANLEKSTGDKPDDDPDDGPDEGEGKTYCGKDKECKNTTCRFGWNGKEGKEGKFVLMTDGGCGSHKVGKDEAFCKKEAEKNKGGYCWVKPLKENKDFVPECHQACRSKEAANLDIATNPGTGDDVKDDVSSSQGSNAANGSYNTSTIAAFFALLFSILYQEYLL